MAPAPVLGHVSLGTRMTEPLQPVTVPQPRRWFARPPLTRGRIAFALTVAVATDAIQFAFGPAGWILADQALDVVAMVLTCWALGFHPLLLPTFVIELIPVADMLPTWTGCALAVIGLRKGAAGTPGQTLPSAGQPGSAGPPVIEIPGHTPAPPPDKAH